MRVVYHIQSVNSRVLYPEHSTRWSKRSTSHTSLSSNVNTTTTSDQPHHLIRNIRSNTTHSISQTST